MIHYRKMTKAQASEFIDGIDCLSDVAFFELVEKWKKLNHDEFDDSFSDLRNHVIAIYKKQQPEGGYSIDLNIGLYLFESMNKHTGFSLVMANDDDIWRYIECCVFPDLTFLRYPKPAKGDVRLNRKRFYSATRRIWMKTLWWYVYLSWQGSHEATYTVLKDYGTDTISDFIERTGKGYRVPLYREIMKQYSGIKKKNADLFNKIQAQNLVNCRALEPALTENGETGYVSSLINQVISSQE